MKIFVQILIFCSCLVVCFVASASNKHQAQTISTEYSVCHPLSVGFPRRCELQKKIVPVTTRNDYTPLIERAGQAEFVLLGDSTHGSHEFYQERIEISKRLIQEKNVTLIAIEGDWPTVAILNQYIHSQLSMSAAQALRASNCLQFGFANCLRPHRIFP